MKEGNIIVVMIKQHRRSTLEIDKNNTNRNNKINSKRQGINMILLRFASCSIQIKKNAVMSSSNSSSNSSTPAVITRLNTKHFANSIKLTIYQVTNPFRCSFTHRRMRTLIIIIQQKNLKILGTAITTVTTMLRVISLISIRIIMQ